jgi:hypothetical protein
VKGTPHRRPPLRPPWALWRAWVFALGGLASVTWQTVRWRREALEAARGQAAADTLRGGVPSWRTTGLVSDELRGPE